MAAGPTIQAAPPQAYGFDVDAPLTADTARLLRADGFVFCVRYLARAETAPCDLSAGEVAIILAAGLALMAVQHVGGDGWCPSADLGTALGAAAGRNAHAATLPPGLNVWLDLENVPTTCGADVVLAYCANWYHAVADAGYLPGIYVGANCGLSGEELESLPFEHYWQSMSQVPSPTRRGYQMRQSHGQPNGQADCALPAYDLDVTNVDHLGSTPFWLAPPAAETADSASKH